jgi:hypothetical protein
MGRTAEQQICGGDVVFGHLSLLIEKEVSININIKRLFF